MCDEIGLDVFLIRVPDFDVLKTMASTQFYIMFYITYQVYWTFNMENEALPFVERPDSNESE